MIDAPASAAIHAAMTLLSRLCALFLAALAACQSPVASDSIALSPSPASSQPQAAATPVETTAGARPALWKVADEDTTIYILGTVHVLPGGIDWFGGLIEQAFNSSQLLVTEITGGDPLEMQALVMDKAMLKGGQTLRELLSPQQREAYEAALAGMGIPLAAFDRFEPWYVSVSLSTLPLMREGFAGEHGVEKFLEARARQRGMAQESLETPQAQISIFDSLPLDVQKAYLATIIAELPRIGESLKAMVEAWKTGDADGLARLMNADESDPVLIDRLLISRNREWARWVDRRLAQPGTVFLAVGAGHLAGAGSLQEQLATLGIVTHRLQ
ncbi:MAG: TraB/GumN family protein [Novosphingobium sp.]|nr:TraB/GumN family protein [Novosphingobium sp.]